MNDRDRLIELIADIQNDFEKWCVECAEDGHKDHQPLGEYLVDKLLQNGVIVPPCKVGDMVYYPWIYNGQCGVAFSEVESIKIYVNRLPIAVVEDWESDMPMPICFTIEDFGETVFLTKEEAEAELRKRSEYNAKNN